MKTIITTLLLLTTALLFSQTKLDSEIYQYFNGSSWVNSNKQEFLYNGNNKLDTSIDSSWGSPITNQWNNSYKEIFSYDANNNIIQNIDQNWNSTTNQWENEGKTNTTFNTNNKPTLLFFYNWNNGQWENSSKIEVFYVSPLIVNLVLSYEWDNSQWIEDTRTSYNYNTNNKIDNIISEEYDGTQYQLTDKTIFSYDANNMITDITFQFRQGNQWINSDKTTYQLDSNLNRIIETSSDFEGTWNFTSKIEYNFDTSLLMANIMNPFNESYIEYELGFENNPFINKILSQTELNYTNGTWTSNGRTIYNYSNTVSVNDANLIAVSIYPNPTLDVLNIKTDEVFIIKEINIFDVLGKKVIHSTKQKINVQQLEKGIYNVEITGENGNLIRKKIIKN